MAATQEKVNLAPETARILAQLRDRERLPGETTVANIAAALEMEPGSVTSRLNGMMRKGLVAVSAKTKEWDVTPAGEAIPLGAIPVEIEAEAERKKRVGKGGNGGGSEKGREQIAERVQAGPRSGSMTAAMVAVMKGRRNPIGAKDLTAEIQKRGLAPNLKGKTPDATVGAKLATEAKKPDGLFERTAPGQFKLRAGAAA